MPSKVSHNCDETRLFSKKASNRTYIHKSAKETPGHKTWKNIKQTNKYGRTDYLA